jgi:AsmA protein
MRLSWRRIVYAVSALLLLLVGVATWLVLSFDSARFKSVAIEWMQARYGRELAFDGPVTLRLWPQPAVTVQGVRLSEPGQPGQRFAAIEAAALTLRLEPLLARREFEIDSVSARGVKLNFRRDADGRRNIDDLLAREVAAAPPGSGKPVLFESIELTGAEVQVADALGGVDGLFRVQHLGIGQFGRGLRSPLHLQAQAEMRQPAVNAALVLDAGFELLPAPEPGGLPIVRLDKPTLTLRGQGFRIEGLVAQLQAESIRLDYGAAPNVADSHVDIAGVQLQFSGTRLGWQVDKGRLGLARLRLDMQSRTLELEQLSLQFQGRRQATTLDAQFAWPALKVVGESLRGGPMEGRLALGGDQRLLLNLSSQAPSGAFERITVPELQVNVEGQVGSSTVQGQAQATLVLEPMPFAAALDGLSLGIRFSDPALPPMQLALQGRAQLSARAAEAVVKGAINDQRVEARVRAALDRPRRFVDVDASFGRLDLKRFLAPDVPAAATALAAAAAPVDLQALQWADARLRLKVARLVRPPYRVDALDVAAAVDNGRLDLQRLAGRAWGGRFEASGSADAGSGQLGLRLRADEVDLRALLTETLGYDGLRGRGRIDADLRSRGATVAPLRAALSGRVALALRPAAIRGIDLAQTLAAWRTASKASSDTVAADAGRQTAFSQLDASFDVRDGVARSTDLDGRSEFLRVAGEGSIDLAQGRMDYSLRARVVNTASGRAGPEMVFLNGVTVPVELSGPFDDVQWQVRWPAVTAAVAALSVPNAVVGTVGGVARGATGVLRGAAGVARRAPSEPAGPSAPSR